MPSTIKSLLILLSLLFVACGRTKPTTHCYLRSGFYLIHGDYNRAADLEMQNRAQWPDTGLVNEVFDFYNDSDKQIAWYDPADYALALEHVIDGHLVVITYASNGPSGFHSAAFWGQEYSDLGDRFDQVAIENIYISYQGE